MVLLALYENLGVRLDLATAAEARRWKYFFGAGLLGVQAVVISVLMYSILRASSLRARQILAGILGVSCIGLMLVFNGAFVRFDPLQPFQAYLNQETWRAASRPGTPHSALPGEWPRILEENDLVVAGLAQEAGTPTGYHPVVLARYEILRALMPHNTATFASLMAVNYARTRQEAPPPAESGSFQRVARQSAPGPGFLWRRSEPIPAVREGITIRAVTDYEEAAAILNDRAGRADGGNSAVVVAEDLGLVPSLQEGLQLRLGARLLWDGPHRGRIQVAARPSTPVVLPLAVPYAPGWHARDLANQPLPVIPVDIGVMAVVLPVGSTGATIHYGPFSFRLGVFLMLAVLAVAGVVAARRLGQTDGRESV
jgi:hypothetical protein